ncbi:MAG: BACON domain-containing protein [Bacteroidales bacterium]|nr:BACON domain-containing protein [Bacteroidales bacterium]
MKRILLIISAIAILAACSKGNAVRNTYFTLGEGSFDLKFEFYGGTQSYAVYSDYDRWTYSIDYDVPVDEPWIKVWPYEGEQNCRFSLKVFPNDCAVSRTATVGIIVGGKQMQSIHIEQGGEE